MLKRENPLLNEQVSAAPAVTKHFPHELFNGNAVAMLNGASRNPEELVAFFAETVVLLPVLATLKRLVEAADLF